MLLLVSASSVYAQTTRSCANPSIVSTTNIGPQNTILNFVGGELWYAFSIDPNSTTRFVSFSLAQNGNKTKFDYELFGPFENNFNCTSLGTSILTGSSSNYSVVSSNTNCITYSESTFSPNLTFKMESSVNLRFYVLKIVMLPGEATNQQKISINGLQPLRSGNSTQETFCAAYQDGTTQPCATNTVCSSPITICSSFTQTHDCSACGVEGNHNRFYVLNILHPNTTVSANISSLVPFQGLAIFSLSNALTFGPCDPSLLFQQNLLQQSSGLTFTHTFPTPGLYLFNVAIQNIECPTVNIIFEDIDANCMPIATPPTVDFQAMCAGNNNNSLINLVYNGNFEAGNHPPSITQINSDDTYQSGGGTTLTDGFYTIVQSPFHNSLISPLTFLNHTQNVGNNGYFMFAHDNLPLTSDEFVWKKQITNILSNTDYVFEAWFTPIITGNNTVTDNLNLYINNLLVASKNRNLSTPGVWEKIDFIWNSGNNTSADLRIEIKNNNAADDGRVFLDDISFKMVEPKMECCGNQEISFDVASNGDLSTATFLWDFGDGATSPTNTHTYTSFGTFTVTLTVTLSNGSTLTVAHDVTILDCQLTCETCIGSFAPVPGQKYLISAWAKEEGAAASKTTYTFPALSLAFNDGNNTVFGPFSPAGDIIDGWQRIEVEFTIPSTSQEMTILLESTQGNVLYDDIRVLPFNSNMKSFVYDPINMRLAAELDERHYATFYEYDEEGQLIRVKKETERGIMTIQETKSNTSK